MPKIVDYDAYRWELANKAAAVFTKHGYSALGMRQIASELGVSKSLLYHYFDGKEELFAASTEAVLNRDTGLPDASLINENDHPEKKLDALFSIFARMEEHFGGELSLIIDYLRGKNVSEIAGDDNMKKAFAAYLAIVEKAVGEEQAEPVLCFMFGLLLVRYMGGQTISISKMKEQLAEMQLSKSITRQKE